MRYAQGLGPIVDRDGIEMAVTVQGRLRSSVIGYLSWADPVSRRLWSRVPREALHEQWMNPRGNVAQFVRPVWHGMLQTAGGTGALINSGPVTEPGTGKVRHDDEAERLRRFAVWLRDAPVLAQTAVPGDPRG